MRVGTVAAILVFLRAPAPAAQWPCEIGSSAGQITVYQPQVDAYAGETMNARAAIAVTPSGAAEPVFGALWLTFHVRTESQGRAVQVESANVRDMKFPEGKEIDRAAVSAAIEQQVPKLGIAFPLDDVRASVEQARKEGESARDLSVAPPRIIVRDRPAVLVPIDGEPVFVDAEGTSLRRVANTPFFIAEETATGRLCLKGGDVWYTSGAIEGPWEVTQSPPREAVRLAAQSASGALAGEEKGSALIRPAAGKSPEIVVSTVPAELIATDGAVQMSPIAGTGLLYAANTPSKLFMEISSQQYYLLISGRWYSARNLEGTWSPVSPERLPADFAKIPPGSARDDVLASIPGTLPAKEAVLDAEVPHVAQVDRKETTTRVEYDGAPEFEPIESSEMAYAVNSSSPVIRVRGLFYTCDRGVWFEGPAPDGPWNVCVAVPPAIYTIPPRSPVYYVRYVRVYGYTPSTVIFGYTSGYTGCYVYAGTVVYGTGYIYRPWYRRLFFPRPWTWGFGVHYDPWTGWSFGYATGWWRPRGWFAFGVWGPVRGGWWGPVGYRPFYRPFAGAVYREGYRPVYRPIAPLRAGRTPLAASARRGGAVRSGTLYDGWARGVSRPSAVQRSGAAEVRSGANRSQTRQQGIERGARGRMQRGEGQRGIGQKRERAAEREGKKGEEGERRGRRR